MEKYGWYVDLLKKQEKDPKYWKEYTMIMLDEFDIVQKRIFELESTMKTAVEHLKEFDGNLHAVDILIMDEFKRTLNEIR